MHTFVRLQYMHMYMFCLYLLRMTILFWPPQPIQLFRTPPSHAKLLGQTCAVEHALGAAGDVGTTVDPQHHGTWPGWPRHLKHLSDVHEMLIVVINSD